MKITKKQINKVLRRASFSPDDSVMRIIMDVGDRNYYVKRAQEYLILAEGNKEQRAIYLDLAIKLLVLVAVCDENE